MGNIIWTNHAIKKMRDRGLVQRVALETFSHPDTSSSGKTKGSMEYRKRFEGSQVTVVAKKNEKNQWIILSAWIDPPLPGSPDGLEKKEYKNYQKAGALQKFLLTAKKQIGL